MHFKPCIELSDGWHAIHRSFSATRSFLALESPDRHDGLLGPFSLPMDMRTLAYQEGLCSDPRVTDQSPESDWIVEEEWWLYTSVRVTFPIDRDSRVFLVLRGLDYLGEVFVDGTRVASTTSFNEERFVDVTPAISGPNVDIVIRLMAYHPDAFVGADEPGVASTFRSRTGDRRGTRVDPLKAAMFHGGDHSPFLMNCGIAIPPKLVVAPAAMVTSIATHYVVDEASATVSGRFAVTGDCQKATDVRLTLSPANFEGESFALAGKWYAGGTHVDVAFSELAVERWHPFSIGFPHCYRLTVETEGMLATTITGFRTVEKAANESFPLSTPPSIFDWHPYENNMSYGLDYYKGYDALREANEPWPEVPREGSYNYRHFVNGREIFVRGGAVVPPTLFWSDLSDDLLRRLVRRSRECNANTLRVWGGGYLCGDAFFEEADLLGVMIAHDYPNFVGLAEDRSHATLRSLEKVHRSIARTLNTHPSVVIINGGNELYQNAVRPRDPIMMQMQRVTAEESSSQLFHPTSPVNPEVHGPWHFDLDHAARYNSFRTIFNSECGIVGCPHPTTLRKALGSAADAIFGPVWQHRQPSPGVFADLVRSAELFGPTGEIGLNTTVARTQFVQAIGYQYLAEEFRRQYPLTNGFTIWEFNEPWPDFNWGIVDAALIPKAAFWRFKRACRAATVTARFDGFVYAAGAEFVATTYLTLDSFDTPVAAQDVLLSARVVTLSGKEVGYWKSRHIVNSPTQALVDISCPVPESTGFVLFLRIEMVDGRTIENDYAFAVLPLSLLNRPRTQVLWISGDCHELPVSFQFLAAAGFSIRQIVADPTTSVDHGSIEWSTVDLLVIGPLFNPLTSLGEAFLAEWAQWRAGGGPTVYFGYNSSAYGSGRYAVDDLQESQLEALLPVTFADSTYGNSADGIPNDSVLRKAVDHPIWNDINLDDAPALGVCMRVVARPGSVVVARSGGHPVIVEARDGEARSIVCVAPFAGHNYMGVDLRKWRYFHAMTINLLSYMVGQEVSLGPASTLHPLEGVASSPPCTYSVSVVETERSPSFRHWTLRVHNTGTIPVVFFRADVDSLSQGVSFDLSVSENCLTIDAGIAVTIMIEARAHEGCQLPEDVRLVWSSLNEAKQ